MNAFSFGRKGWIVMSLFLLIPFLNVASKAANPAPNVWGKCTNQYARPSSQTACTATFLPADEFPACLSLQMSLADCEATPEVTVAGCVPAADVLLGRIEVRDEDGTLISLWEVSIGGGSVVVVLIDID